MSRYVVRLVHQAVNAIRLSEITLMHSNFQGVIITPLVGLI